MQREFHGGFSETVDRPQKANGHDHSWKGRFRLIEFDALIPGEEASYLVKSLIPRTGLTVAWGPPKCGKSFWVFDLMMHVALRWDYHGHRVKGGPVVYLALEGASGFRTPHGEAFRRHYEPPTKPAFSLIADAVDLITDHELLIKAIKNQSPEHPVAVVIDTLNRSLHGSESSNEGMMAAYIRAADDIRDAFQCAVIVVHHCGHDDKRPRQDIAPFLVLWMPSLS